MLRETPINTISAFKSSCILCRIILHSKLNRFNLLKYSSSNLRNNAWLISRQLAAVISSI
ncbi:hypothetical protein CW304_06360 [Bacillus sp. UFRGS-B20]|nr:hypothetical protein CW304_06360 [Bacillus sp. UFRGS-B20]